VGRKTDVVMRWEKCRRFCCFFIVHLPRSCITTDAHCTHRLISYIPDDYSFPFGLICRQSYLTCRCNGWSPDPVTLCILYLRGIAVYRSAITLMIDSIRHFSTAIKVVDECWEHWKSTAESLCKATTRVLVKTILC